MRRLILAAVFLACGHACASAATLYAKSQSPTGNWSEAATWSSTGCAGLDSSGPPDGTTDVIIEACAGPVVIDTFGQAARTVFLAPGATLSAANGGVGLTLTLGLNTTGTIWSADSGTILSLGITNLAVPAPLVAQTVTFAGGGLQYGMLSLAPANTSTIAITGSNQFRAFFSNSILSFGNISVQFDAGATNTFDDFTVLNAGPIGATTVSSATAGVPTILAKSSGTINIPSTSRAIVTDTTTSGATWCNAYASADGGGNTGWTFAACPVNPAIMMIGVGK